MKNFKKNKYYCCNEEVTIDDIVGGNVGVVNNDRLYRKTR